LKDIPAALLLLGAAIVSPLCGADEAMMVVATRYLQAEGVSHAHLYLYKEDGTFVRQLTKFEKGQDHAPLFSPDGKEILFLHTPDSEDEGGKNVTDAKSPASLEPWRIETSGKGLKKLPELPDWYRTARNADHFTPWFPDNWPTNAPAPGHPDKGWERKFSELPTRAEIDSLPVTRVTSPGGVYELILKLGPDDLGFNGPGNGKFYELSNLRSGKSWRLGELPGFLGLTDLLHESSHPQTLFLQQGALNVVFFSLHMGSTFGEACIALDLKKPSLLALPGHQVAWRDDRKVPSTLPEHGDNPGNAIPMALPGEPFFLVLGMNRYEPIPGSKKTANISYLTRFDAALNETPYVQLRTAPIFYGASLYRPGKSPAVIKIGQNIGRD